MATNRREQRASYERQFKAQHGVSTGTYYTMRRAAAARGISPKTFDKVAQRESYTTAKQVAIQARTDLQGARYNAAVHAGVIRSDKALSDFDSSMDAADIPDDMEWWYH